jgi:rRNA maturation RNase YbeY
MINVSHNHPFLRFPKTLVPSVLRCVYAGEGKERLPSISVVFTTDKEIRMLNRKYLQHHGDTDIITFDLGDEMSDEAELYINLDAARRQADEYNVTFGQETRRLLIHGALHLLGYDDATAEERDAIHKREDGYLSMIGARKGRRNAGKNR